MNGRGSSRVRRLPRGEARRRLIDQDPGSVTRMASFCSWWTSSLKFSSTPHAPQRGDVVPNRYDDLALVERTLFLAQPVQRGGGLDTGRRTASTIRASLTFGRSSTQRRSSQSSGHSCVERLVWQSTSSQEARRSGHTPLPSATRRECTARSGLVQSAPKPMRAHANVIGVATSTIERSTRNLQPRGSISEPPPLEPLQH